MDKAKELYTNAKVKPTFDETTGQNFVSYEKGDSTVSIWLEDATSVKSRLDIMEKYKLARCSLLEIRSGNRQHMGYNLSVFQIGCFHKLI